MSQEHFTNTFYKRGQVILPLLENGFNYNFTLDGLWKALAQYGEFSSEYDYRKGHRLHGVCKQVRWRWNCTRNLDLFAKKYHEWLEEEFSEEELPHGLENDEGKGPGRRGIKSTRNDDFVEQALAEAELTDIKWTGLRKYDFIMPLLTAGFDKNRFVESLWLALTDVEHFEITDYEYDFWNCPRLKNISIQVMKRWSATKSRNRFMERNNYWLQEEFALEELPDIVRIPCHEELQY